MEIEEVERIEEILSNADMSDEMKAACIYGISFTNTVTSLEAKLRGGHDFDLISNDALQTTLEFYDADNVIMTDTDVGLQVAGNYMHEITRAGVSPVCGSDPIYLEKYPMFLQTIEQDQAIVIPDIGQLFPEDSIEYKRLEQGGIHSFIAVPYHKIHSGLVAVVNPRRYTDKIGLLQVLSYVSVAEINEKFLTQLLKENRIVEPLPESADVYVKFFDGLEIHSHNGVLTEHNIKSSRNVALLAFTLLNGKTGVSGYTMEAGLWLNATKPVNARKTELNISSYLRDVMSSFFPDEPLIRCENFRFSVSPTYHVRTDLQEVDALCIEVLRETDVSKKIDLYKKIIQDYSGCVLSYQQDFPCIRDVATEYDHKRLRSLRECLKLLVEERRYDEAVDLATPEGLRYCTDSYLFYWLVRAYIGCGELLHAKDVFEGHKSYLLPEQIVELNSLLN